MIELPSGRLICNKGIRYISNIYLHEIENMPGFDVIYGDCTQINILYDTEQLALNDRNYLKDKLKIE